MSWLGSSGIQAGCLTAEFHILSSIIAFSTKPSPARPPSPFSQLLTKPTHDLTLTSPSIFPGVFLCFCAY